jgi:hypothetical protein
MLSGVGKLVKARALVSALRGHAENAFLIPDTITPSIVPSVSVRGTGDRVLAEMDQEGFLFASDSLDIPLFNRRTEKLRRHRSQVDVVLREGAVLLRKRHLTPVGATLVNGLARG